MKNHKQDAYRIRNLVIELWAELKPGNADIPRASEVVAKVFKRERDLDDASRGAIVENLYGMLLNARRIQFALQQGTAKPLTPALKSMAEFCVWQLQCGELSIEQAARLVKHVEWQKVSAAASEIAKLPYPQRLAVTQSLPDWLAKSLLSEYGGETEPLAHALNQAAPQTIRVNTLKISRDHLMDRLIEKGIKAHATKFAQAGVIVDSRTNLFRVPEFGDGLFEVQDESSQLLAELVAPPPHGITIDVCAGAGGKSLAIGALTNGRGRIFALDIHARKLEEFERRARRAGLSNHRALKIDPEGAWPDPIEKLCGRADRVLVDAPCSGTGTLRRNPELRWRLKAEDIAHFKEKQISIAHRALRLIAPGGRLIYSTCSLLEAENEQMVEELLSNADYQLVLPKEILGRALADQITDASGKFLKLLPHKHGCDGFFAAVLRKKK